MTVNEQITLEQWEAAYEGDQRAWDDISRAFEPIVHRTVRKLAKSLPEHVHAEDLLSAGYAGYYRALTRYINVAYWRDHTAPFEPFVVLSVRSVVLDDIRAQDWAPRSVRKKQRLLTQAISQYASDNDGRVASDEELLEILNWDAAELSTLRRQVDVSHHASLNEMVEVRQESSAVLDQHSDEVSREDAVFISNFQETIVERLWLLPPAQQAVLALRYYDQQNFIAIAAQMGVSESKVTKAHLGALAFVRTVVEEYRNALKAG